jgi:DNA-3-methyladenine glycosylase
VKKLPQTYFKNTDTLFLAKNLLGKVLATQFEGVFTSGRIVETEAYLGEGDRASHAFGGKRTQRTEPMFLAGGYAYVYLCYGLHHLFNVVTHKINVPHAILIRAVEPLEGIDAMQLRRRNPKPFTRLTKGPGSLSEALGIKTTHSGLVLGNNSLFIADDGFCFDNHLIKTSTRIGVEYAGEDAGLPYRFFIHGNPFVSGLTK